MILSSFSARVWIESKPKSINTLTVNNPYILTIIFTLFQWHLGQVADMLSSDEKGMLILGLINFILLIFEVLFIYYVIKVNARYFLDQITDNNPTYENSSEIYTLLLVLLLIFTIVLFLSSITFTVLGFKVFRKILRFSREVVLIIPIRDLEEPLEDEDVV